MLISKPMEFFKDLLNKNKTTDKSILKLKGTSFWISLIETIVIACIFSQISLTFKNIQYRNIFLFISIILHFFSKLFIENRKIFIFLTTLSIFLFTSSYSLSDDIINYKGIILINKINISSNFTITLLLSLVFSSYFIFLKLYLFNTEIFPSSKGIFMFLKLKLTIFKNDLKENFKFYSRLSLVVSFIYIFLIHIFLSKILILLRINLHFSGIFSFLCQILKFLFSLLFFNFIDTILDTIIIYNKLFYFDKNKIKEFENLEINKRIWFYSVLYEKNNIKVLNEVKEYVNSEIITAHKILYNLYVLKKSLDSQVFISVPQPNKGFSKKYKAFLLLDRIWNRIKYEIELHLIVKKYNIICNILKESLNYILNIKNQEIFNIQFIGKFLELGEIAKDREILLDKNLNSFMFYEIYNIFSKKNE